MNKLWKVREWLTTGEGATYLSSKTESTVREADVLRLALDGHLALSVNLPPGGVEAFVEEDADTRRPARMERIDGVWELPMQGAGRVEVECRCALLQGLPCVEVDADTGAAVARDGVGRRLPPDPGEFPSHAPRRASALPQGSQIVVRREVLDEFAAGIAPAVHSDAPLGDALDKPLKERERVNLLVIIAALAGAAKIDVSKPSKAGGTIEALAGAMGARIAARTVEFHLRRIPDALERRGKLSN